MTFFDWNHDGKKNYVDNAIEKMIIDDIENEKQGNNRNSTPQNSETDKNGCSGIIFGILVLAIILIIL